MKVHVVVFLRKTEKFYDNAAEEYAKRLGRFCKLQITRVPPGKKVLQPEGLCVLVQPGERMISSEKLAEEIAAAGEVGAQSDGDVAGIDTDGGVGADLPGV